MLTLACILRYPLLRRGRQALSISRRYSLRQESSITTFDHNAKNVPSPPHGELALASSQHRPPLTANSQAVPPPGSYYGQQVDAADVDLNAIAKGYRARKRMDKRLLPVGSEVEKPPYRPQTLLANPPTPNEITLELLMAAQTHMGHATASWNPATSRYILGVRHGIHIISLEATAAHLRRACRVVEEMAYAAGLILFVGTRKGQAQIVARAADLAGACRLWTEWVPGTITNRDVLLAGAPVKAVNELDQPVDGFEKHVDKARPLMPDLVVCFNPLENYAMLQECGLANIPTIGVIDTDADPSHVTYSIPANDDSLRSIAVIAGALGHAGAAGLRRRLTDAKDGRVTWKTPWELREYLREQEEAKEIAAAAAASTEPSDARRV